MIILILFLLNLCQLPPLPPPLNTSYEEIRIAMASAEAVKDGGGVILNVEFSADENAQPGTKITLNLSDVAFYDQNGDLIDISSLAGTITIIDPDTDGDDFLDDWEMTYFGDLSQGPDDDYDGDQLMPIPEISAIKSEANCPLIPVDALSC